MYGRVDCTQMQGNIHPHHMEWLIQQRMQGIPQTTTPRAYHLEPMTVPQLLQQRGSLPEVSMGQHPGGGLMDGISVYGPGHIIGEAHGGHTSPFLMGVTGGAACGTHSVHGTNLMGHCSAGCAANNSERNNPNLSAIFNSVGDPKIRLGVVMHDKDSPLPFPPGNLLAQYPTEYQQQLIFYYRLLRMQYPELYQQYVDYYEKYYEPLYHPQPSSPQKEDTRPKKPKAKPRPPPQELSTDMQQPLPEKPQPVYQPPPPVEQLKTLNGVPRTTSNLGGELKQQSSLRRQNSMRRNEVNQMKNAGGLKRLPSMRKQ